MLSRKGKKWTLLLFHDYFSSDWQVSTWTVSPDMLCFTWHLSSHSFITLPQPSLVIGNTALEKLCCSSTWAFNTSITLQSASTSNFSHSKQSFSLTVPLNMFQPPPLKRLKCLSSSWSVSAIGNVTAARTGMMTLKSCPYLTYFRQLSISNGQWTAFF